MTALHYYELFTCQRLHLCVGPGPILIKHGKTTAQPRETSPALTVEEIQDILHNAIRNGGDVLVAPVTSIDESEVHATLSEPPKDFFPSQCEGQDKQDKHFADLGASTHGPLVGTYERTNAW